MFESKMKRALAPMVILLCCIAFAFSLFAVFATHTTTVYADASVNVLAGKYVLGSSIEVQDVTKTVAGEETLLTPTVMTPSGKKLPKGTVTLGELGQYRVEYRGKVKGEYVKFSEYFVVVQNSYSVSSARSSAKFGEYVDQAASAEGLRIELASGDTFEYNKILDLTDFRNESFVKFFMTPVEIGSRDAEKVNFVLTDAYDPENTVTITVWSRANVEGQLSYRDYNAWVSANAATQIATGIDLDANGPFEYNGRRYRKLVGDLGTSVAFSFFGTPHNAAGTVAIDSVAEQTMDLTFDIESAKVYVPYGNGRNYSPDGLVADLDDPLFFSELWGGFTTGQVYLSVKCEGYSQNKAGIFITDICGENLGDDTFADTDAPELEIDTGDYASDDLPIAKIGKPYKIFPAYATDFYDDDVDITTVVYYNYYADNKVVVNSEDGKFVPYDPGQYTLEYTAVDDYGMKTVKRVQVHATLSDGLVTDFEADENINKAGFICTAATLTAQNASGKFEYTATAEHIASGTEYEIENGNFLPLHTGEYKIVYKYSDYVEKGIAERTVTVAANSMPVIIGENNLPKYLLRNCVYPVPAFKAYDLSGTAPVEIAYTVSVAENGVERTVKGKYFAPQTAGDVRLDFKAEHGGETQVASVNLKVLDVGYGDRIDMAKYFLGDGTAVAERGGVRLTSAGGEFEFANVLDSIEFETRLRVRDFDAPSAVGVILTDVADVNKRLKFTFSFDGKSTWFSVNDSSVRYAVEYDASTTSDYLYIGFYNGNASVTYNGADYVKVRDYLGGKEYEGMGDAVYVSIFTESDTVGSVGVLSLNGHSLSDAVADLIAPRLFVREEISGTRTVGDVVTVSAAVAYDVLDPNVTVIRTVTDPNGNICISTSGVLLDLSASENYELEIKEFGRYTVTYQAVDGKGNIFTDSYIISSVDKAAPVIKVTAPQSSVKAGSTVSVGAAEVTDNVSEAHNIVVKVYVTDADGRVTEISNGGSFTATKAGRYTVTYMAIDEAGNSAFESFSVTATN